MSKMEELENSGIMGQDNERYNFYRAVSIVTGGIIVWSKRYGKECRRLAELEANPERRAELLDMAERLRLELEEAKKERESTGAALEVAAGEPGPEETKPAAETQEEPAAAGAEEK